METRGCTLVFLSKKQEPKITWFFCFSAGEVYFEMHEDKICRAIAQMLLQNAVKFNLSEFQEVWQQSVPEGMTTRLDQLQVKTWSMDSFTSRLLPALCHTYILSINGCWCVICVSFQVKVLLIHILHERQWSGIRTTELSASLACFTVWRKVSAVDTCKCN